MAANDSGKTIAVLALVGILGAGAFMGNSWLNAQHADHNIVLNDFGAFRSALSGDAEAQYTVGKFYADAGEWQNAIFWLNKSADQNNAQALSETAMAYLDGRDGVPKDVNHACRNLEKVYDLHKDAANAANAGFCYDESMQAFAQALPYYQIAAKAGNNAVRYKLGRLYDLGQGTDQNYDTAAYWYRQAAKGNNAPALYSLALMYMQGHGVPKSPFAAYVLAKSAQAKQSGNDANELARRNFDGKLSEIETAYLPNAPKAKAEVEQYVKSHSGAETLELIDSRVPYTEVAPE
ncbi:tetratricopeptide repeat protein [Kingella oralis]|uniref:tetratricopeptide repeat protein n=1 Tax=Kingella oralis TaxID=505 RepID=UPI002D7FADA5|nr:tetratricopeptide repeat protein [Kingella oralis]